MSRAAHDTARAMLDAGMTPDEAAEAMVRKPFQFQRREVGEALAMLRTIASAAAPTGGGSFADSRNATHEPPAITDEAPEVVASALEAAGYTRRLPAGRADRLEAGDVVVVHVRPGGLAVSRWRRGG